MKKLQIIFLLIILAFTFVGDAEAQETKAFSETKGLRATADKLYDYEKWNFSIGSNQYEIKKNGKSKRIDGENGVTNFHLKIGSDENLVRIYFTQYEDDLILLCEDENWDAGAGFIARLDGKTLKTKWRELIPGFNVAKGLIEGNSAYLAAIGFVAKINLDTGKYIWKHDDFYRKYKESGAFNIFEIPKIERSIITFTENQNHYNRPPNIIKFNKNSGEVIEVKVN